MAERFKNLIHPASVRRFAAHLHRASGAFDRQAFERLALSGLESLELKARAMHLASALEATLPRDFARAADLLEASLAPAPADESAADDEAGAAGKGSRPGKWARVIGVQKNEKRPQAGRAIVRLMADQAGHGGL